MKQCPICDTSYPDEDTTCSTDGALLVEIREWAPGSIVRNKYRILGKVGQGGMGIVYKAEHMVLEEVRALKVMNPSLATDQKFVRRFRQEAQAARRLQHANAVHVDDCEQADDGSLFIAMDYVEGITLRQLLRATKGPLPIARALGIARGIAGALAAAEALGMVHRDIKPGNILIARDRQGGDVPKVTDFGIAAMRESAVVSSTRPLLTPAYAAPEQWSGMKANELDGRADLYALGITLYEMLTGRLPFSAETQEGWQHAHCYEAAPPPSKFNKGLKNCPEVDKVVLHLLEKDRERRPRDAKEFIELLNGAESQAVWNKVTVPHNEEKQIDLELRNLLYRASRLFDDKNYEEAAAVFEEALRLDPANQEASAGLERAWATKHSMEVKPQAQKLLTEGRWEFDYGNYKAAVSLFEGVLRLDPGNSEALKELRQARSRASERRLVRSARWSLAFGSLSVIFLGFALGTLLGPLLLWKASHLRRRARELNVPVPRPVRGIVACGYVLLAEFIVWSSFVLIDKPGDPGLYLIGGAYAVPLIIYALARWSEGALARDRISRN
jgi:serine/threonine protein kinase